MHIEHMIEIDADVPTVWRLNTNVVAWPSLTPTVTSVERLDEGALRVGSRARVKQPAQRAAVWTVTMFEPEVAFAWGTTSMGMRMVGTHRVEATGNGCRTTLSIDLAGPVARLLGPLLRKRILATIATENAGFRREAEKIRVG
jgi:hypothetical protein